MKRSILLALLISVTFAFKSNAQFSAGATIGAQFPTGDFGDLFNTAFGFNVIGKYHVNEQLALGLNIGYNDFDSDRTGLSMSITPITGTIEYYFDAGTIKPFIGGDLGFYNVRIRVERNGNTEKDTNAELGLAPMAGIAFAVNEQVSLVTNLKYNFVAREGDNSTWFGLNIGAFFRIN